MIAAMLIGGPSVSAVQAAGPNYVSVFGGFNSLDDPDISTSTGELSSDADGGFGVGIAIGRWFDTQRHWRAEVEASYRENDIDSSGTAGGSEGEINSVNYMVNGYYDFRPDSIFSPYLGAGIGFADIDVEGLDLGSAGTLDDDDSVFSYQLIGGVSYQATATIDLFGELRYLATEDAEFSNGGREFDYETASALAGLRYRF